MSDSQALTIRPARTVSLAPDALEQRQRYLADADLRAQLADAIEAEASALKQISDGQALWETGEKDWRALCRLNVATRQLVVTVKAGGKSIVVCDDTDPLNLVYNRPDGAKWPEFIIAEHKKAQSLRDVMAEQERMASNAAEIQRQSLI